MLKTECLDQLLVLALELIAFNNSLQNKGAKPNGLKE